MSDSDRVTPLLSLPFNSFLMLRLEYVLLTGNDLQALLLRLIEKGMEDQRRCLSQERLNALKGTVPQEVVLDIPTDVWAPISHASFLYDLYGLVQSENTLKKALQELCKRKLIFKRKGQGRYAPDEYQLNLKLLNEEFKRMQQQGKAGYHPLTPSQVDTLMASSEGQRLIPSEGQKLIPSEGQKLIPSEAVRGSAVDTLRGSEVDTNNRKIKKIREERFREEVAEEESKACRFENATPFAAAAGLSEREECFSSPHDKPAFASGQPLTPAGESGREQPTQTASGARTARSTPVPVSQKPQKPGHASGAGESSLTSSSPAGSMPTFVLEQPIAPTLSGAQAQASVPANNAPLSPEAMVALVERLLGVRYDAAARARQLEAARQLLAMKLLPDLSTLERVYAACYDDWWRQHYGLLHLTHLVERETSGQPRILRLLARLLPRPVAATPAPSSASFAGWTAVASQSRPSGEEADAWLKQNQRDSLEKLLRNGDQLVAKMRANGDREAERFAACLQFLKQQQAQGGIACNG